MYISKKTLQLLLSTLSFEDNIISGYRIYIQVYYTPARGKYYVEPATADRLIQLLVYNKWLQPIRFQPDPERCPGIGVIGYNANHFNEVVAKRPVAGHFVDWDYKVIIPLRDKRDLDKLQLDDNDRVVDTSKVLATRVKYIAPKRITPPRKPPKDEVPPFDPATMNVLDYLRD